MQYLCVISLYLLVCCIFIVIYFQALVMLHLWVEKNRGGATGNALERALRIIRREDIIHKCIRTVEEVTDVNEKETAKAQLDSGLFLFIYCNSVL